MPDATSPVDRQLVALLGSATKARVLKALFNAPANRSFHLRGLAADAGVDSGNALKALRPLVETGWVAETRDARGATYRANTHSPMARALKELLALSSALLQDLAQVARTLDAEQVHVFGSHARGTERPDSDVDVLVIGDLSSIEAQAAFRKVGRKHGKQIDVLLVTPRQLAQARMEDSPFLKEVLNGKLITLKGGDGNVAIGQATPG